MKAKIFKYLLPAFLIVCIVIVLLLSTSKTKPLNPQNPTPKPQVGTKCIVGGCSSEVCVDEESGAVATICVFKKEYACYKTAKCEVQENGKCGWTQTEALLNCLGKK